jgi:hypothetical protein
MRCQTPPTFIMNDLHGLTNLYSLIVAMAAVQDADALSFTSCWWSCCLFRPRDVRKSFTDILTCRPRNLRVSMTQNPGCPGLPRTTLALCMAGTKVGVAGASKIVAASVATFTHSMSRLPSKSRSAERCDAKQRIVIVYLAVGVTTTCIHWYHYGTTITL